MARSTNRLVSWRAKLRPAQVRRIRELYPGLTQTDLAARFHVSQTAISSLLRRRTYRRVKSKQTRRRER